MKAWQQAGMYSNINAYLSIFRLRLPSSFNTAPPLRRLFTNYFWHCAGDGLPGTCLERRLGLTGAGSYLYWLTQVTPYDALGL